MAHTIYEQYTEEEIQQIIAQSTSWRNFAEKLGYSHSPSGATIKMLQEKTKQYNTDHFSMTNTINKVKRNEDNIFIENSTAEQSTLRRWYKNGNYTSYVCSICGLEPVWQGKELTLILDHINGTNNDDRLENLRWVCPNCNQQLETTGFKIMRSKKLEKKYYCIDCGIEISRRSVRCAKCDQKHRIKATNDLPISRDELKQLIRNTSFVEIGNKYGVTDNAIRKWCDKFNLPRKVSDIKKISNEDWDLI